LSVRRAAARTGLRDRNPARGAELGAGLARRVADRTTHRAERLPL